MILVGTQSRRRLITIVWAIEAGFGQRFYGGFVIGASVKW